MADQADGILSPWLRHKRIAEVRPYLQGRVLDYGCGIGMLAEICHPDLYLGVDSDTESLEIAAKQFPDFHFTEDVPGDERFDTIVLLAVIEHIAEPERFLTQLQFVLEPHGQIVLTTPHPLIDQIHSVGSKLGLFSKEAYEEHEQFLDYASMARIGNAAEFVCYGYKRFLFGANQLFILEKK